MIGTGYVLMSPVEKCRSEQKGHSQKCRFLHCQPLGLNSYFTSFLVCLQLCAMNFEKVFVTVDADCRYVILHVLFMEHTGLHIKTTRAADDMLC
jgi:hypothetical protein